VSGDYEDLFRRAPFGYVETDLEGTVTQANDTLLAWLHRDQDAVAGREFGAFLEAGSRLFYETRHRPTLLLQDTLDEVALTLVRADGSTMPVLANSAVVRDETGHPVSVRIGLLDAAQRHEYERTLLDARRTAEASEARLRILQTSTAGFVGSLDEDDICGRLAESVRESFDAATATVLLADDTGDLLTAAGTPRSPLVGGPVRFSFDSRTAVVVQSLDEAEARYPEFVDAMRSSRVAALAAVPLFDGVTAIGVVMCTFGRTRPFDADSVALLKALALQGSLVLVRLRLQAELRRLALHDPLTGLANRQLLHDQAERARLAAARSGRPFALIFFDLDGFKQINDRLGHQAGDTVLGEVAGRLQAAVRAADAIARFGGDEFVVVCEDAGPDAAAAIAERIRAAVAVPLTDVALPVTASVGVAVIDGSRAGTVTTDHLLQRADEAMYASKNSGRDRVTVEVI
jgi:serine/threonine-protein kinase RsbW